MTTQDTGTPTPPEVEQLATQEVRLERTALIGVFGATDAPKALVLLPRGRTKTVAVGDRLDGSTVVAIGSDQLMLSRGGASQVLRIPGS